MPAAVASSPNILRRTEEIGNQDALRTPSCRAVGGDNHASARGTRKKRPRGAGIEELEQVERKDENAWSMPRGEDECRLDGRSSKRKGDSGKEAAMAGSTGEERAVKMDSLQDAA